MAEECGILIACGTVVGGGTEPRVIHDGAVAVRGGLIAEVGQAADVVSHWPGADVLDASGKLVMPGFVNVHTHLYSALARGITARIEPSENFVETLEHLWWRLDRALSSEDIWYSAAAAAIDLVRNGTTTIVDHHASQGSVAGSLDGVSSALGDVGLRANVCFEVSDRWGPDTRNAGLLENERFAAAVGARNAPDEAAMLGASLGLHASFTLEDDTLDRAAEIAGEHGIGCHIHVAEDRADVEDSLKRCGKRVVERLAGHGVLGSRTVAAHCIHIDENEAALLRDTDTVVAHNPQSNMNNAVGRADVIGLLERGVLAGLGTDGFTASMLDEMRVANLIHRHDSGDPRVGHGLAEQLCLRNNPTIASRLFGGTFGTLEPGAVADIIVLDYTPRTPLVARNVGGHVLFGLTGWMVETVVINGRFVMKEREFTSVDADQVLATARELAENLWSRM
jgi:putative selenium metabolism protein SsnA